MPLDWKQFFEFLGARAHGAGDGPDPVFSPENFLRDGLEFLRRLNSAGVTEPGENFLGSLPVERLLDADERLRSYYGSPYRNWPANVAATIALSKVAPPMRQSLLFLGASHGNGYIREQVVELLSQFPGKLALAAALIRCADWVPMVRGAAQKAVVELLDLCASEDVAAVWPLVIRMRSRERLDGDWFARCVEGWMLRSESSSLLMNILSSQSAKLRAWGYEKCLGNRSDLAIDLLDSAVSDPDPRIALLALKYSVRECGRQRTRNLATVGLTAHHPVLRRESLRLLASLDEALPREIIHGALRDKAAGVRAVAAFLLRERYSEQAVAYWRSVIDRDITRPTLGALASLADNAEAEDVSRFRRWLDHPGALVRLLSMQGIVRGGGLLSDEEFLHVVSLPGVRLQRELARQVRSGNIRFDVPRIMAVLATSDSVVMVRENLRRLLRLLNHWERLFLILSVRPNGERDLLWFVAVLGDWIADSDRYVPFGSIRRDVLLGLLESRRGEMDEHAFWRIQDAINRH